MRGGGSQSRTGRTDRARRALAAAVATLAGALPPGCGGDEGQVVQCEVMDAEPIRVPGSELALSPAVGLLDGKALVSWAAWRDVGELRLQHFAQWMDPNTAEPLGERMPFGDSYRTRPRWVRYEGSLYGQVWAAFTSPADLEGDLSVFLRRVEVPPPGDGPAVGELLERSLPEECPECGAPWPGDGFGEEGMLPIAIGPRGPWLAMPQEPGECPFRQAVTSQMRLHLTTGLQDLRLDPVHYGEDYCRESDNEWMIGNAWLIDHENRPPGVLFRRGFGPRALLYYGNLTAQGDAFAEPPRLVDLFDGYLTADSGMQAKGVAVGEDRILFSQRRAEDNRTQWVQVMDGDGRNAREAAWRPGTRTDVHWVVRGIEWVPMLDGAVAVWAQRTFIEDQTIQVTSEVPWEERVQAAFITSKGKLGSEVVQVSDPSATALDDVPRTEDEGPFVGDFVVASAVEGDTVAVVWNDKRPWAPGVYLRRLRCRPIEP